MQDFVDERIDSEGQLYLKYDMYRYYNQRDMINYIVTLIKSKYILFPYKRYFAGNPLIIFRKFFRFQIKYDEKIAPSFDEYFKSDNKGTMLLTDNDYKLDLISDIFQEPVRLRAHKKNKISPLQDWPNSSYKVISEIISDKRNINPENMREYLYMLNGNYLECTQFRPTVAMEIYTRFEAKNILDMSAGWGDRLIGAIASGYTESYLGFDPNKDLEPGHTKMIETFCPYSKKDPNKFKIEYIGFEQANLAGKKFDMMFTSPPFFDFEVYSNDKQQSINTNPTFNSWIKNFLFKSIAKCWDHLEDFGKLVVYIGDTPGSNPIIPMNIFINQFPDSKYLGSTCFASISNNKMGRRRYIWMWEKDPNVLKEDTKYMLNKYPEIFSV